MHCLLLVAIKLHLSKLHVFLLMIIINTLNQLCSRLTGVPIGDPRVQRKIVAPKVTVVEAAHVIKNMA